MRNNHKQFFKLYYKYHFICYVDYVTWEYLSSPDTKYKNLLFKPMDPVLMGYIRYLSPKTKQWGNKLAHFTKDLNTLEDKLITDAPIFESSAYRGIRASYWGDPMTINNKHTDCQRWLDELMAAIDKK